jgi:glycosyltransferase involved in cell wall biosynthesis
MRKKLHLPLDKKIVLYTGSLYANRGIDNILKLAKLFPQVYFLVIGGPEKQKNDYIKSALIQKTKNIRFLGYIPHFKVKDYLIAADVLLMIWSKEVKTINYCSPLKVFEYMASGRIIVGHAFPTIKEVLTDGETAYLTNPDSFDELQMKISLALAQNYPNSMAQTAQRLALNKYSWKVRAQTILESINT